MTDRDALADLIRIIGNLNSRVHTYEGDIKRIEDALHVLIKEVAHLKQSQYHAVELTYSQLHEH